MYKEVSLVNKILIYKTNFEIGVPSKLFFKDEVEKYSFMWRDGGQFSTNRYQSKDLKK